MATNGDNGTIGANGANDDPFETMMIHWSYNGSNSDNGSNDDNGENPKSLLPFYRYLSIRHVKIPTVFKIIENLHF